MANKAPNRQPAQQEARIRQQLHKLLQDQPPQFIHVIQGWLQQEECKAKGQSVPQGNRTK